MTDTQFNNARKSAGLWFCVRYLEYFLVHYNELDYPVFKEKCFVKLCSENPQLDIAALLGRSNCLKAIIKGGYTIKLLDYAVHSSNLYSRYPQEYKTAVYLYKEFNKKK